MSMLHLFPFFFFLALSLWPFGSGPKEKEIQPISYELPSNAEDFQFVRILLEKNIAEVDIGAEGGFYFIDSKGRLLLEGDNLPSSRVRAGAFGLQIGTQIFRDPPIQIKSEKGTMRLNGKPYHDALVIHRMEDKTLTIVNYVDIEEYLKGVLPWEANPQWGMEVLKAQAVASRTYALFKAVENRDNLYDMTKDSMSQVYAGKVIEKNSTSEAVEATRGQIMTFRGTIFPAYFHSTCGGATTRADYVWPVYSHPVFKGVPCDFCRTSKHYSWQKKFLFRDVESKLNQKGFSVFGVTDVIPANYDESGRARYFVVEHQKGKTKIPSNDFRLWMGAGELKSTRILSSDPVGDGILYRGRGWGHGVGMCQYGAKRLDELGYTYRQILEYYYLETNLIYYFPSHH